MYINQARMASGAIYDNVDSDAGTYHLSYIVIIYLSCFYLVKGLMTMRKYWYHTLDFTMCSHYSGVAWSLAKLVSIEDI